MKKTWEEPQILVQKFIPNEYVAACGDSGTTYGSVEIELPGREYMAVLAVEDGR